MRSLLGRFHRPMSRGLVNNMLTMNNLGDGSTLSLDFTTGVLDPRLTFTRSTTATYINSSGYVTSAAINAPRFDYSPTNIGEPRGLLIEGQGVNIATRSDDFAETPADGTNWANSGYTVSLLSTSLPNGSTGNARRIVGSGSGSFRSYDRTVTASTVYTWSFWARNNGGSQARYRVWNASAGSSIVDYNDSANNYVSLIGGANNTSSTWVRISKTFTTPAGCTSIFVYPMSSDSGTVDLLVWGAQLELGSGASSYIPTGASQVTRTADTCYLTDFAGWSAGGNFNTAEGTLFVDQAVTFVGTVNYPLGGFGTSNTTGARFGWQYRQGDSPQGYRGFVNAGYIYEAPYPSGWSIPAGTTRFRHAMSCGGGTSAFLRQSFKSSASSGSPTQNTYSDVSTLNISGVAAFTLTQSTFASSVRIARVKYYPRAFTLTELDQLTN